LCKGITCVEKVKTVLVITMTLSALYWLLADSTPFSVWQHNKKCSRTKLIFLRPLFRVKYCPESHNGKVYISSPPGYDEDPLYMYRLLEPLYGMLSAARALHTLNPFTACPLQPELGTPP